MAMQSINHPPYFISREPEFVDSITAKFCSHCSSWIAMIVFFLWGTVCVLASLHIVEGLKL